MSYHQFQMFEKIGTEESQIETSIELSEIVNLFIMQNTLCYYNDQFPEYNTHNRLGINPSLST